MNMVEIWFGILTNQAIRPGSFDSVAQLIGEIKAFLSRWNEEAKLLYGQKRQNKSWQRR